MRWSLCSPVPLLCQGGRVFPQRKKSTSFHREYSQFQFFSFLGSCFFPRVDESLKWRSYVTLCDCENCLGNSLRVVVYVDVNDGTRDDDVIGTFRAWRCCIWPVISSASFPSSAWSPPTTAQNRLRRRAISEGMEVWSFASCGSLAVCFLLRLFVCARFFQCSSRGNVGVFCSFERESRGGWDWIGEAGLGFARSFSNRSGFSYSWAIAGGLAFPSPLSGRRV
jgi:hypothetical protein